MLGGGEGGVTWYGGVIWCYRTPASRRAFCRIVSLTAAKTRRILLVSVACVKLRIVRNVRAVRKYCG